MGVEIDWIDPTLRGRQLASNSQGVTIKCHSHPTLGLANSCSGPQQLWCMANYLQTPTTCMYMHTIIPTIRMQTVARQQSYPSPVIPYLLNDFHHPQAGIFCICVIKRHRYSLYKSASLNCECDIGGGGGGGGRITTLICS